MATNFASAIAAAALAQPTAQQVMPILPGLTCNIDGDYLAYYAAGNEERSPGAAREKAIELIEGFRNRVGADRVVVHNTAQGSQKGERYLIATVKGYQEQRKGNTRPKNQPYLQDWLMTYTGPLFTSKTWLSREADDGFGAMADYAQHGQPGYAALATADKDMRMLPGLHINWLDNRKVTRVMPGDYDVIGEDGKQYGLKWFWLQMLMGDTVDNIPGLPGYRCPNAKGAVVDKPVGEKTAEKLLADCTNSDEAYVVVRRLYHDWYYTTDDAYDRFCEQAGLLWMRLGNDASVTDFATHSGASRINGLFCKPMWAAVNRLQERVKLARQTIDQFGNSSDAVGADSEEQ